MLDLLVPSDSFRDLRQANHKLDDLLIQPTSLQTRSHSAEEPHRGPSHSLGAFDDDGITCEEGGEDR